MAPVTAAFRGSLSNRGASRARTAPVVTSALWCAQMPVAVPVVAATAFAGTAKRALCKAERVNRGVEGFIAVPVEAKSALAATSAIVPAPSYTVLPVGYTPVPLFSESGAHFLRPTSRTCSTGELSGAATGQEVLLARAVAVETAEEAAVDARRSFLKRASEGTRRPSLASPLVSEVAL